MFNGSGVYTLPGAALANGDIVSATENNQFRNDVAAALNIAWTRDGQAPATANIPMGSHKFTGLAAGTGAGDSVRYEQLPGASNLLPVASGGTGSGTASGARTNLGVVIGTDVQAYAAELQGATQGGINGMKNRIINGDMRIDQRNAGASVATTTLNTQTYTLDRWNYLVSASSKFTVQQNAGSVTPPAGFTKYLGVTSTSAYSVGTSDTLAIGQWIEGFNVADLAWGTASASTVTLSFKVYSSLTGTFGGSITNGSQNRAYPFTFVIGSANTWASISVTIPGDTTGTWATDNSSGLRLWFSMGAGSTFSATAGSWSAGDYRNATGSVNVVGTNGATFYITGVQLEKGSTATSFDYRPYGTELALCQRYYQVAYGSARGPANATGDNYTSQVDLMVAMRTTPTCVATATREALGNGTNVSVYTSNGSSVRVEVTALAAGDCYLLQQQVTCSAEL